MGLLFANPCIKEGTILRRRTEPLSLDKSTLLILIASTSSTDGRGFPTVTGDPRSFSGFPLKFTWSPGWADAISIGIFGWVVAQLKARNIRENKRNKIFIETILIPPFN
jgi:hypothetical protein